MGRIDFVTGNALVYLPDVEALAAVPDEVEELIQRGMLARTGSDGRSAARILGDLVAYAEHDRVALHRIAWMSDPVVRPLDFDEVAQAEQWETKRHADLLDRFTKAISETVDLLKDQPDAAWGRPGLFHDGRRSFRQQVRRSIEHYRRELDGLRAVTAN